MPEDGFRRLLSPRVPPRAVAASRVPLWTTQRKFDLPMLAATIWIKSVQHSTREHDWSENTLDLGEDRPLLLVDDDEPFLRRLAKAMKKRGFRVETAALSPLALRSPQHCPRLCRWLICGLQGDGMVGCGPRCFCATNAPMRGVVGADDTGPSPPAVAAVKIGATELSCQTADATDMRQCAAAHGR